MTGGLRVLIVVVVLSGTAAAHAQSPDCPGGPSGWIVDQRTGCRVWNACPHPDETVLWSGACVAGLAEGSGLLHWYRGGDLKDWYDGGMKAGRRDGRGVLTGADGKRYEGEFSAGLMNGRGALTSGNGSRYEGTFRAGLMNGWGTITYANGNRYVGQWRHGRPDGIGKAKIGRSVFDGAWSNGCFQQGLRTAAIGATRAECGF